VRPFVTESHRIVVKVGSSSLTTASGGLDTERVEALVAAVLPWAGRLVLVSSGAIAAGLAPLGLSRRPRDLATLQAAASVGQSSLVHCYATAFGRAGHRVGQVLLTATDVVRRTHYRNARTTLDRLLELGVIPIVNENDAVATQEIRLGDNDRLAAIVAHLVSADLLVLLSDVDGVYDANPRRGPATLVREVRSDADLVGVGARGTGTAGVGVGGMATKIEAARMAASGGVTAIVTSASNAAPVLSGKDVGTVFHPTGPRKASRLLWLAHATAPEGRLHLDDGAVAAVLGRRASLLPAGVTAVDGDFSAGDPVDLVDPAGRPVARGLVAFDAAELPGMLGRSAARGPLTPGALPIAISQVVGCTVQPHRRAPAVGRPVIVPIILAASGVGYPPARWRCRSRRGGREASRRRRVRRASASASARSMSSRVARLRPSTSRIASRSSAESLVRAATRATLGGRLAGARAGAGAVTAAASAGVGLRAGGWAGGWIGPGAERERCRSGMDPVTRSARPRSIP
jgi:glutamate 5-kinase